MKREEANKINRQAKKVYCPKCGAVHAVQNQGFTTPDELKFACGACNTTWHEIIED